MTTRPLDLDNLISDKKYTVALLCRDCGRQLNETCAMTGDEVRREWLKLVTSAALMAGKCPNGCRSTWSDCNINTEFEVRPFAA